MATIAWSEIIRLLESTDPTDLEEQRARHFHHALGLAHYHSGDVVGALRTWRAGQEYEGECRLVELVNLADALLDRKADPDLGAGNPFAHRLVAAVRHADTALCAGDHLEVIATLDHPWVWRAREMQSLGRLAAAYLSTPDDPGAFRFSKRLCLAAFCYHHDDRLGPPRRLPIPEIAWTEEQITEVAHRASEWLDSPAAPGAK